MTVKKEDQYVVMLDQNIWLAKWGGDPGRTLKLESAKRYKTISSATFALARARRYSDFKNAEIYNLTA